MENFLELLYNPKCIICEYKKVKKPNYGKIICNECIKENKVINSTNCVVCDQPSIFGTTHIKCMGKIEPLSTYGIFEYNDVVRKIIKQSKYNQKTFFALIRLTEIGIKQARLNGYKIKQGTIVLPIPSSKKSLKDRGFNQANFIAKVVAKNYNLKLITKVIIRNKKTEKQFGKSKEQRYKNLENAFFVTNKNLVKKRDFVLVDDVWTSGATFREAAKSLYKAGAHGVYCFSLSKAELIKSKYDN